jgi:hypothetical protein
MKANIYDNSLNGAKVSKKWKETALMYKYFSKSLDSQYLDFSISSAEDMYNYESTGFPLIIYYEKNNNGLCNGYAVGKHFMDITLSMWKEDLKDGILKKYEILNDFEVPEKLKEIVRNIIL